MNKVFHKSAIDMTENYRYPNIRQSVWILVSFLVLVILLVVPLYFIETVTDFPLLEHPVSLTLIQLIVYGLILARGLKRAKASLREICPLVPVRLSLLLPMALTVIGTFILLTEINNLLLNFLPPPASLTSYVQSLVCASRWGMIIAVVVVAPVIEELLFRGLILRGFLSHYSTRKAILASAIIFGLFHLNPWQFIGATTWGILFAWWFIQTRSILPCVFGHALVNALACRSLFRLEIPGFTGEFPPRWLHFIGFVLAALGVWLLIHQFRKSNDTVPGDVSGDSSDES